METVLRRHSRAIFLIISWIVGLVSPTASWARKIEAGLGGYSFSATNPRNDTSSSLSGFGSYHLAYRQSLTDQFDLDLGYSLVATDGIGGDLSFGVDLGFDYYPFGSGSDVTIEGGGISATLHQQWRPFLGVSFNQRNFQSTSSQYAGVGAKIGTEYHLHDELSLGLTLRYLMLGGPNQSTATQIDILFGPLFQF